MFQHNISLKPYNTFGIDVSAESFVSVTATEQLQKITEEFKDIFILSGGSNILFTKDLQKPVIHLKTKGVEILENMGHDHIFVKVQAGENWHEFVKWCLIRNFGGVENLSLIPGNVGTSPMQNIGAYGVEIKDVFYELEALDIKSNRIRKFTNQQCDFGYRESYFKKEGKGKYIILNVTFRLTRKNHILRTNYGAIQSELKLKNIKNPGIRDISRIIINIRRSKLPDPKRIGNGGSFFKNPVIDTDHYNRLKEKFPAIPSYPAGEGHVKIPAGWLIEQLGFKGKRYGHAGVHKDQALVIVNYGNATGDEILQVAKRIQRMVKKEFDIPLEMEVNIV